MHVAFWSPAWPVEKHQNGIITYVNAMRRGLESRGHRVSVFTGTLDEPTDGVFHVRRSRWRLKPDPPFDFASDIARAILREHRRHPIDVIEMEESWGWCADVARRTGIPMVVKLHGPAFYRETDAKKIELEGLALKSCQTIISPSHETLRGTLERYQLANKDTEVIVNPITVDRAPVWSLDSCDHRTIIFIGRVDLNKGADVVLKAMQSVLKTHPNAKLIIVGPDNGLPGKEGWKAPFLWHRDAMFRPEQRGNIIHHGPLPSRELAALRVSAMVTVVASRWENLPYTLLEAMAQGCPVVSTSAGGCQEVVSHGRTGLLARSGDPEDLAEKICAMLDNPDSAAVMGASAREQILERYSLDHVLDATLKCYQRVIAAHRREGASDSDKREPLSSQGVA